MLAQQEDFEHGTLYHTLLPNAILAPQTCFSKTRQPDRGKASLETAKICPNNGNHLYGQQQFSIGMKYHLLA